MGQANYPICTQNHENENKQNYRWCYYEAFDYPTNIVEIVFLASLLLTFVQVTKCFKKLLKLRKRQKYKRLFGDVFVHVYILIYAWLFASIIKVTINIFVYYLIMEDHPTPVNSSDIPAAAVLSVIFVFLDYFCPYCLLFLMLLIPYQWANELLLNTSEKQQIPLEIRQKINFFFKILKFIRIYFAIRSLFLILLICEPFLILYSRINHNCDVPKLNSYLVYADSLVIFVIYLFSYYVGIFMQKNSLIVVSKRDEKRIKIQFLFLFGVVLLRIILNFFFKLLNTAEYKPNSTCADFSHQKQGLKLGFLITAQFFMHLLPILTILYIYRPSIQERKRDEKILNGKWQQSYDIIDDKSSSEEIEYSLMTNNINKGNVK